MALWTTESFKWCFAVLPLLVLLGELLLVNELLLLDELLLINELLLESDSSPLCLADRSFLI